MDDRYSYEIEISEPSPKPLKPPNWRLHIGLFVATFITTSVAGTIYADGDFGVYKTPWHIYKGFSFSLPLMLILLSHEMGHYIASRSHKVEATLPYFIPIPPNPFQIIGTFGAFIKMKGFIKNKAALMDIGAAGPLTGFILSIIAIAIGLPMSDIVQNLPVEPGTPMIMLGEPLAFKLVEWITMGSMPANADITLHPIAFAGWLGLFVTSINLLPIGQLDGGHISFALFGKRSFFIGLGMIAILLIGAYWWEGWGLWAILASLFGLRHPPPMDPYTKIDLKRQIIGWISLAVFILSIAPRPFYIVGDL